MRKFKLLKDLPGCKAGDISIAYGNGLNLIDFGQNSYSVDFLEEHPEWFEEIKEEQIKESKKTIRRWLWVYKYHSYSDWMQSPLWMTEKEATHLCKANRLMKTTFNGQEVWQDFEE